MRYEPNVYVEQVLAAFRHVNDEPYTHPEDITAAFVAFMEAYTAGFVDGSP